MSGGRCVPCSPQKARCLNLIASGVITMNNDNEEDIGRWRKEGGYERIIENRIINGVENCFMNSRHNENLAEV